MKCRRCKQRAAVDLKSHNTAFCHECFVLYAERQVKRAIKEHRMLTPRDRVLLCVSGGKDSLVLWDLFAKLGMHADGLYLDLGIAGYSSRSRERVEIFAKQRGLRTLIVSLEDEGIPIPALARRSRRGECSVCGTVKRHFFNRTALEGGYSVVATGHNLDDEAGRLLGNLLHWQWEYLVKQAPALPAVGSTLVRKVQPLCRLSERETAAYAVLEGIDYVIEECPMSRGATSIFYKRALNLLEDWMPGTKLNFYHGFLKSAHRLRQTAPGSPEPGSAPLICSTCGFPAHMDPCTFCRLTGGS